MHQATFLKVKSGFARVADRGNSLLFKVLFLMAAMLGVTGAGLAQATGSVTGIVTDPAGQLITAANVDLTNTGTGDVRHGHTGKDGVYVFPQLAPGSYMVQIVAPGFKTQVSRNVEVEVNGTTRVDGKLAVGATTEEVTITTAAPLVETGNATMGVVVEHEQIVDLPLNGRNFAQLGQLIPGVIAAPSGLGGANGTATPGGFGNSTGSFNVNGMRNQSNNFLLDGAPNNDSFNSGFVVRPPPDAIEEFKILTHSYEAQYGRNAGSVVNVVTKSGTNHWHGSVWEFNREAAFAAKNWFTGIGKPKPNYQQNQFGGAGGGAILRDRLFVYGFYEGFRLKDATSNVLNQVVPTGAERAGDFSDLLTGAGVTAPCSATPSAGLGQIADPLTGAQFCFGGKPNQIDPSRISAITSNLLKNYVPLPNTALAANPNLLRTYSASPANIDNRNMYGIRGDYKLGPHSILARYLHSHQNLYGPITPSNFPVTGNLQLISILDGLASDTWVITPHVINVIRYSHSNIDGVPNKTSGLDLATAGYQFSSTSAAAKGLPNVTLTSTFTTGDAQQPFAYRSNTVDTLMDDFTWVKGRHTFMFGGEGRRDAIGLLYINRPNGAFTFTTYFTGNALSDFYLGLPQTFQQGSGDPALNGSSWTYSVYGQDQFRINSHVTIEAGVRYELNQPYTEAKNHLAALHPGQQSTVQPTAPVGLVYPGDVNTPGATYNTDINNVAPRLGVIFDPMGDAKTTFRAAWGLFYDTVPGQGDFFQNGTLAPPFQPLQQIDFNARPKTAASPNYFANPYLGVAAGPVGFPVGLTFIGWSLPDSFRTPRVQQYNLSLQHQVSRAAGFELAYVGSRADALPIFIEVNPTNFAAAAATNANAYTATTRAVFPAFALTRPTFSVAKSWYDSLQAQFQLRGFHHARMTAAYTWSHSQDHVSGLNIGTDSRPILPVTIGNQASIDTALAREKGNSLFDVRNRFVLSFAYELPRFASRALVERLFLGGWQLNGIFQAQTGFPFTVVNSTTTAQSLTFRPNVTCDAYAGAQRKPGSFFNTGCFALPTVGTKIDNSQSGNEGRNQYYGPGFNQTDASLFKIFNITEAQRAEFRFEVFNVLNEARFAQPNATLGSSTFGQITSTIGNDSRVIQMAFKYSF